MILDKETVVRDLDAAMKEVLGIVQKQKAKKKEKLTINQDIKYVHKILDGIEKKEGYCPCQVERTPKSNCPFESQLPYEITIDQLCINGYEKEECCCKLYK